MNRERITIISPIYNVDKLLTRCLESLRNQTFGSFEVLLIDDGSTDNSGVICDEYAKLDSRFRVIHKVNGGVGSARQVGLEHARGEYVIHCDPDDWVEPQWLEGLYQVAASTNADVVISDHVEEGRNGWKRYVCNCPRNLNSRSIFEDIGLINIWNSVYCFLIRRQTILDYAVSFYPGVNRGEDGYFMRLLYTHDMTTAYIPEAFYHYCHDNDNSITSSCSGDYCSQLLLALKTFDEPFRTIAISTLSAYNEFHKIWEYFLFDNYEKHDFLQRFSELKHYYKKMKMSFKKKMILWWSFTFSPRLIIEYIHLKSNIVKYVKR